MVVTSEGPSLEPTGGWLTAPATVTFGLLALSALAVLPTLQALESFWREIHDYRHGYLIAALAILWIALSRERLNRCVPRPNASAAVALGGLLLGWLIALNANSQLGQQLLVPLILGASVYAALGREAARAVSAPLAFFIFAIPVWDLLVPALQRLTVIATQASLGIGGVPVIVSGSKITIPEGTFLVADGCSGKHYLVVCLALAALAAAVNRLDARKAVLTLVVGAAVAIVGNWVRVIVIVTAGHLTQMRNYLVSVDHLLFGNIVFLVLLAIILAFVRAVAPADAAGPGARRASAARAAVGNRRALIAAAGLAVALSATAGAARWSAARTSPVPALAPPPVAAADWRGPLPASRDWRPHFVGFAEERRIAYGSDGGTVEVYVNLYGRQRQGRELIYFENSLLAAGEWRETDSDSLLRRIRSDWAQRPATLEAVDADGNRWALAFLFQVGGTATGSELGAQVLYGAAATLGEPHSGVVAAAARCEAQSCAAGHALLDRFWQAMSPRLRSMVIASRSRDGDST